MKKFILSILASLSIIGSAVADDISTKSFNELSKAVPQKSKVVQFLTEKNRWKYEPVNVLGVDVRRSVWLTGAVDTYQTSKFKRLGLVERWNPLAEAALNGGGNWLYVPAALLSIAVLDDVLRKADPRDRPWMYVVWYGLEIAATLNNKRLGTGGVPIVIPVISKSLSTKLKQVSFKL